MWITDLGKVLGNKLGHLKHRNNPFSLENLFQVRIGIDIASVLFVLEVVLFDVDPEFFDDLRPRHWPLADDSG